MTIDNDHLIDSIEHGIKEALKADKRPTLPLKLVEADQTAPPPLPVDDVGLMAADAVLKVYEATAQRIEEMGDEVKKRIDLLDRALIEAKADLEAISAAAVAIREKGDKVRAMIVQAAETSKTIRDTCAGFVAQVAAAA